MELTGVGEATLRAWERRYGVLQATVRPRVLVGPPPGAVHDLGASAFAVAARRAGLAVTYVGSLPVPDWLAVVERGQPACVVVAVSHEGDLDGLRELVEALRSGAPEVRIGVGGWLQDRAPALAEPLGHRVGPAADRLASALPRCREDRARAACYEPAQSGSAEVS